MLGRLKIGYNWVLDSVIVNIDDSVEVTSTKPYVYVNGT